MLRDELSSPSCLPLWGGQESKHKGGLNFLQTNPPCRRSLDPHFDAEAEMIAAHHGRADRVKCSCSEVITDILSHPLHRGECGGGVGGEGAALNSCRVHISHPQTIWSCVPYRAITSLLP